MHPVLFEIGAVRIFSYGVMLSLGFTAAVIVSYFNARRHGVEPWAVVDMALWLFIGGLAGSRLLYVALNWSDYAGQPLWRLAATWEGGVSFYGAIAGGLLAAVIVARRAGLSLARVADTTAPGVALAAAIGRVGCFLNGCCYGLPTTSSIGVFTRYVPGLRHPTQLYEAVAYLAVFVFLLWWQRRRARLPGQVFLTFVWAYLAGRYVVEFFRADGYRIYPWLSLTQAASLAIAVAAVAVYWILERRARRREETPAEAAAEAPPAEAPPAEAAAEAAPAAKAPAGSATG